MFRLLCNLCRYAPVPTQVNYVGKAANLYKVGLGLVFRV
jgi:hypothetical protein